MLPAVWGAVKAASLGQRAAVIGGIVLMLGGLFTWGWLSGKASCEKAHQLELLAQALAVGEHTGERAEAVDKVDEAHQARESAGEAQERVVYKEVVKYVQAPKKTCLLDPEYVRLVDELIALRTSPEGRVLEADEIHSGDEAVQAERASTTQLLLAFAALSKSSSRDGRMIRFMQDYDEARYNEEMRFWNDLPPEARGGDE